MTNTPSPLILVQAEKSGEFKPRSIRDVTRELLSGRLDYEDPGKLEQQGTEVPVPRLLANLDNYYGTTLGLRGRVDEKGFHAAILAQTSPASPISSADPPLFPSPETGIAAVYLGERFAGGIPSLFIGEPDSSPETRFPLPAPGYSRIPIPGHPPTKNPPRGIPPLAILGLLSLALLSIVGVGLLAKHLVVPAGSDDPGSEEPVARISKPDSEGIAPPAEEPPAGVQPPSSGFASRPTLESPVPSTSVESPTPGETTTGSADPPALEPTPGKDSLGPSIAEAPPPTTPSEPNQTSVPEVAVPEPDSEDGIQQEQSRTRSLVAELRRGLARLEQEFETEKSRIDQSYIKALRREETRQVSIGDLDAIQVLREEIRSVDEDGRVSASLPDSPEVLEEYRRKYEGLVAGQTREKEQEVRELRRGILRELTSLQKELTLDGQIKDAIAARDLIADLRAKANSPPGDPTPKTSPPRNGEIIFTLDRSPLLPGRSISHLSVLDANGDGRPDLLAVDSQSAQIHLVEQRAPLVFETSRDFSIDRIPSQSRRRSAGVADFDHDGSKELLVAGNRESPALLLERGFGLSAFSGEDGAGLDLIPKQASILFGDINGDSFLDICAYGSVSPTQGHFPLVFLNNGSGQFRPLEISVPWWDVSRVEDIQLLDFDLDADLDILFVDESGLKIFRNQQAGSFRQVAGELGLDKPLESTGAWGDVDNDGDLDFVGSYQSGKRCALFVQDEEGLFREGRWAIAGSADSLALADFNADGYLDLLRTDAEDGAVLIYPNEGGNGFGNPVDVSPPYVSPSGIMATVSDLDGDTDEDIVLSNWGVGIQILENQSNHRRNASVVVVPKAPTHPNPDGAIVRLFSAENRRFLQLRVIGSGNSESVGQREAIFHGITSETSVEVVFPGGGSIRRDVSPGQRRRTFQP